MTIKIRIAYAFLVTCLSVAKRDLKGFCAAAYGSPYYAGYAARACQSRVKNNMKKPEDCTEHNPRIVIGA